MSKPRYKDVDILGEVRVAELRVQHWEVADQQGGSLRQKWDTYINLAWPYSREENIRIAQFYTESEML